MKRLLILCIMTLAITTGCSDTTAEDMAMSSDFNVTFDKINLEESTATFTVEGLPNDEEFEQIDTIITDSLNSLEIEGVYTISVYSSTQQEGEEPAFGTTTYEDGETDFESLHNITMEDYLGETQN